MPSPRSHEIQARLDAHLAACRERPDVQEARERIAAAGVQLRSKSDPVMLSRVLDHCDDLDLAVQAILMEPRPQWVRTLIGADLMKVYPRGWAASNRKRVPFLRCRPPARPRRWRDVRRPRVQNLPGDPGRSHLRGPQEAPFTDCATNRPRTRTGRPEGRPVQFHSLVRDRISARRRTPAGRRARAAAARAPQQESARDHSSTRS